MSPAPPRRPGSDDDVEKQSEQISKEVEFDKVKSDNEGETKLKSDKELETKPKAEKEFEKVKREKEAKEIEKIKPEKEQKFEGKEIEKIKADKEFEKAKPEKEFEKVKADKEFEKAKADKELDKLKSEKEQKLESKDAEKLKDDKEQIEKVFPEKQGEAEASVQGAAAGLDAAALLAHADSLMETGRQLRHFIERSMRPDLSTGALQNEEDQQKKPDPEQDDD